MYSTIQTYFNSIITSVNSQISGTSNDLIEVTAQIDRDDLPANQSNNWYYVKINETNEVDNESRCYDDVSVIVECEFLMANDMTNYHDALDKLVLIKKYLKASQMVEGTYFNIIDVKDIKLSGLNNIVDNWLKCNVEFNVLMASV